MHALTRPSFDHSDQDQGFWNSFSIIIPLLLSGSALLYFLSAILAESRSWADGLPAARAHILDGGHGVYRRTAAFTKARFGAYELAAIFADLLTG